MWVMWCCAVCVVCDVCCCVLVCVMCGCVDGCAYVWDVYVRTAWQDGKVATALGAVRRSEATAVWSGVV